MHKRTPTFLMANLGAEVTRLLSSHARGDQKAIVGSFQRAIGIIREIESFPEMSKRKKELEILEGVIREYSSGDKNTYLVPSEQIKKYFTPFAMRVLIAQK
ncbi:MAG: hypothetical protein ABI430_02520 [Candidatus Taylorbacteria bacterium]